MQQWKVNENLGEDIRQAVCGTTRPEQRTKRRNGLQVRMWAGKTTTTTITKVIRSHLSWIFASWQMLNSVHVQTIWTPAAHRCVCLRWCYSAHNNTGARRADWLPARLTSRLALLFALQAGAACRLWRHSSQHQDFTGQMGELNTMFLMSTYLYDETKVWDFL